MLFVLQIIIIHLFQYIYSYDYSNIIPILPDYTYGNLNQTYVEEIAINLGTLRKLSHELKWFASKANFFTFQSKDNLLLQGYYIPSKLINQDDELINQDKIETIVFCTGWTEATIQYARFIHDLYNHNYSIFSYDLRSQGFSQSHIYDNGKVTYVDHFYRYMNDLEDFITTVIPKQLSIYHSDNKYIIELYEKKTPIYIGLSLSGLIGLSLILEKPDIISDIVLVGPCIAPSINIHLQYIVSIACSLGFERYLATRIEHDDTKIKATHSIDNAIDWDIVKHLLPHILKVAGPSYGFLNEMLKASRRLLKEASNIKNTMLLFQSSEDDFVDNVAMTTFFTNLGNNNINNNDILTKVIDDNNNITCSNNENINLDNKTCEINKTNENVLETNLIGFNNTKYQKPSRIIRYHNAYHALLKEIDYIYNQIMHDLFNYLQS